MVLGTFWRLLAASWPFGGVRNRAFLKHWSKIGCKRAFGSTLGGSWRVWGGFWEGFGKGLERFGEEFGRMWELLNRLWADCGRIWKHVVLPVQIL